MAKFAVPKNDGSEKKESLPIMSLTDRVTINRERGIHHTSLILQKKARNAMRQSEHGTGTGTTE